MFEPQYHYDHAGMSAGPVPSNKLLQRGVGRDTLVWTSGMNSWVAAGQIEALAPLFVTMPPPLPPRPTPPPLPSPHTLVETGRSVAPPVATAVRSLSSFAPNGYSLPLLGKFADDLVVWAMDSGEPFGAFANNADLQRLHEWNFQSLKQYRFLLQDPAGQTLLTLYKPKAPFFNPLKKGELHVLNGNNSPLGICRRNVSFTITGMITVEDMQGDELMKLNLVSLGSRDFLLETPTGIIGRGRRSRTADWTQLLLEFKDDRYELIFEPEASESLKALGIGAVVASYLLVSQF